MVMAERLVFLTGHLAKARLEKLLAGLGKTEFAWEVVDIGAIPEFAQDQQRHFLIYAIILSQQHAFRMKRRQRRFRKTADGRNGLLHT